jgi:hypothetical protein
MRLKGAIPLVLIASVAIAILVAGYVLVVLPHAHRVAGEKKGKQVQLEACLKDQASLPKALRTSGTYVDCQSLYK